MATGMAQFLMHLKRTRRCVMTLEGRVAEYLSHKQNRNPDASKNINECPAPQKKDDYHSCLYFFRGFLWHKLLSKHPPLGKATELF